MRLTAAARLLLAIMLLIGPAGHLNAQQTLPARPAVALFYGAQPPTAELQAFDLVVVEPDHVNYAELPQRHTRWFAYVSVGEVQPSRGYFRDMPAAWLRAENPAWRSRVVDQTAPGWPEFFETRVIAPLWQQGYRGFFLDTLDSYHLFASDPAAKAAQEDALVALINRLHARFPGVQLIFNRGFEILPRLKGKAMMVAAESLYLRYDAAAGRYSEVPAADREWLLAQFKRVQDEHAIPVLAIDYAPHTQRVAARAAAAKIRALGFIPWVTSGGLDQLGVGDVEVVPRRVALITDRLAGVDFQNATGVRYLALPLHHLGYTIDVYDVAEKLPERLGDGSTAAIVTWFSQPVATLNPGFAAWLQRQIDAGLRLVVMNRPGFAPTSTPARSLGFVPTAAPDAALTVLQRDPIVGFESQPLLTTGDAEPLALPGASAHLLSLRSGERTRIDAVGITEWGGFALAPFAVVAQEGGLNARWIIDPIEFLRRALRTDFPIPDVTTEAGRRLLLVHVDGDGFASRAEMPGTPFAPEVMLNEVIRRYRIPHTISIIQGEVAGTGMFRELAPALEGIARRIFAEPNVEVASHSYSHPFYWRALAAGADQKSYERALNLNLPGYKFNLDAEIAGSATYINERLAPAGKRTRVFLWTGDTVPTTEAVVAADGAGLLNMNGGDTTATRAEPTLMRMSGFGLRRGRTLQVFAPNQNENVYTNLWTGPFYGYQRVIETFELTEVPRRLKPINIYYHTYSASKQASLTALNRVYRWALAQPTVPVYASDYIRKVIDFHGLAIARDWRTPDTWRIRGAGDLRTLRVDPRTTIALADSRNVAGFNDGPGGRYVHLSDGAAELRLGLNIGAPYVREARGWISDFTRTHAGIAFTLNAYGETGFALADARACRARVNGRELNPLPGGDPALLRYELADRPIAATPTPARVDIACRP